MQTIQSVQTVRELFKHSVRFSTVASLGWVSPERSAPAPRTTSDASAFQKYWKCRSKVLV